MAGMLLPAASLLGAIYAGSRGDGGGSEFGPQQERLFDTQADIAEMMKGLYESRIANEEQYLGDAMGRVFQYADWMQNRSPDLLNAPGIFEFMPKGRQREGQAPEWQPFTPEGSESKQTVNPPLDDQGLRDLEALNPVTDVMLPIDMNALAALLPRIFKQMGGESEGLEEALGQKGETDTDWDAWLNDMPETLRSLERTMEDTLGTRDKPELNNPYRQQYDPKELEELMTRVMSTSDFTPPSEYSGPFEDYIDPITLEVVGPTVPDRSPIPDIDVNEFLRAIQAEAGSGVSDFTGLVPGIVPEPAWRSRSRDERIGEEVEQGQFFPEEGEGSSPIRPVSGSDVQKLLEWATTGEGRTGGLQFVLEDGSSATSEQIMAYANGEGPPLYLRDIWTGAMLEAGYLPGPDQDDLSKNQLRLTEEEIDALLVDRSTQSSNDDVSGKTSARPIKDRR
jgi:hypothetical protein